MPFLKMRGRSRRFYAISDKKEMWKEIFPFLRNPILRTFRPERKPDAGMLLGGTSALGEYSMLGEDRCITYVVQKDRVGTLGIKGIREVPKNEEPACIIQEVGYVLPFGENKAMDPLSLVLMLTDEDRSDPRVESCINEMLEDYVW